MRLAQLLGVLLLRERGGLLLEPYFIDFRSRGIQFLACGEARLVSASHVVRQRGIRLAGSVASARELLSFGTEPATRPCNFSLDLREHVTLGCLFLRHGRKFLSDLCAPVLRGFGSLLDLQKLELQFVTSSL